LLPQFAADLEPAHARQANIQENGVVGYIRGLLESLFAGFSHVNGVGILSQSSCDEASDLSFVFD
jgi:hypothetical protein